MKIEFNEEILVGNRCYRKGDVAEVPDARAKSFIGAKMASQTDKDVTNFTDTPKPAEKADVTIATETSDVPVVAETADAVATSDTATKGKKTKK